MASPRDVSLVSSSQRTVQVQSSSRRTTTMTSSSGQWCCSPRWSRCVSSSTKYPRGSFDK